MASSLFTHISYRSLLIPLFLSLIPASCSTGNGAPTYRDSDDSAETGDGDGDGDGDSDGDGDGDGDATASGGAPQTEECDGTIGFGGMGGGSQGLLDPNKEVTIMPFGDSITAAEPWRLLLAEKMDEADYKFKFVGSEEGNHEGHSGLLVTDAETQNALLGTDDVPGWAEQNPADVVLFMWGTNDAWNNPTTSQILDAYTVMVEGLRAENPDVVLLVAQLFPMRPDATTCEGCTTCARCLLRVEELNEGIPDWARCLSTEKSPIYVVDHFTGFDLEEDTDDKVHPNEIGAVKQADNWFNAIRKLY